MAKYHTYLLLRCPVARTLPHLGLELTLHAHDPNLAALTLKLSFEGHINCDVCCKLAALESVRLKSAVLPDV